jgi:hypothetical protein
LEPSETILGSSKVNPRWRSRLCPSKRLALELFSALFFLTRMPVCFGQAASSAPEPLLPEAPQPHNDVHSQTTFATPCEIKRAGADTIQAGAAGAASPTPDHPVLNFTLQSESCPPLAPLIDWYARFLDGPQVKALSPKQKAWLATRNLLDPFNGITILGISAIAVASNSHSPYGPGMPGFGRNVGVSFTEDMTGEFFGTFLIPSIVHQDPHYHRLPNAPIKRRIAHALYQVVWTQGDNGQGMLNYANLVGFAIDDEIDNLYVPGRQTDLPASASRYATGLATAPIENFVTEFVPDLARRLHVRIVLVQSIINRISNTGSSSP